MSDQLERVRAALAGRYEVERELGAGGMATVYLARDTKHDRMVAVKVLHPDLAASVGGDRFLREIRLTAKLSHPHILPLYDSGEADGLLFYVMPFVEGESLADMVTREKQLSIRDAVQIVREVAEALGYAHSLGLVHRDIKPDNIMMSGGHAIVADFGIARAVSEAGGDKLTQTGMAVGTPSYMSPEQVAGDATLDPRSDLYSLGCVLYELMVGQVPFTGPTPLAVMARHSMDTVPPPHIMRPSIPPELEDVVFTAMAKVPADRFRTAHEMVEALNAVDVTSTAMHRRPSVAMRAPARKPVWRRAAVPGGVTLAVLVIAVGTWAVLHKPSAGGATVNAGPDPKRIAVMYFRDLSRDSSLGYLGDGLTEALIDRLTTVPELTVMSRDAVAPYRRENVPRDSISRALNVGSLVTGSVEPAGERTRVTVRLVDGPSGSDIESRTFELPSKNAIAVRDSAAEVVAGFLRRRLGEQVTLSERRAGTTVVEAWTLVQRAERLRKDGEEARAEHPDQARALYHQADSLLILAERADPRWPDPIVMRAWTAYDQERLAPDIHGRASQLQAAIADADRALALNPGLAEALHIRGRSRFRLFLLNVTPNPAQQSKLLDDAQADLQQAVKIDPGLANAWYVLSILDYSKEDVVAATLAAERAYEADAFLRYQDNNLNQLFQTHYDLEQFANAQRWCDEGGRRFPKDVRFTTCQLMLMITPYPKPDPARAWALARRTDSLVEGNDGTAELNRRMARIWVAGALGRAGLADSARHVLVANRAGQDLDPEQELAVREAAIRVILGDQDEAINLLQRYVLANPGHKFDTSTGIYWWWRPLKDNPRFESVAAH